MSGLASAGRRTPESDHVQPVLSITRGKLRELTAR